jgi:hypothetical protein
MTRKITGVEKTVAGALSGAVIGAVAATVGTIWGGYELGTAINDALHITNTAARGSLDFLTMCIIAGPAYSIGTNVGAGLGIAFGGLYAYLTKSR